MISTILRFLIGLLMASLSAAVTTVLFVITPADILALQPEVRLERLSTVGLLILVAFTQSVRFAFAFALIAAVFGSLLRVRSWPYFVFAGLAVAWLGFAALLAGEGTGQPTIANSYALAAYTFAGLIGGYVYWLFAGRGERRRIDDMEFTAKRSERGDADQASSPAPPTVQVEPAMARSAGLGGGRPTADGPGSAKLRLSPDDGDASGADAEGEGGLRMPAQVARTTEQRPAGPPSNIIEPVSPTDRPIRRPLGDIAQRFAPVATGLPARHEAIPTPPQGRVLGMTAQRQPTELEPAQSPPAASDRQASVPVLGPGKGSGNGNGGSVPRAGITTVGGLARGVPPAKPEKT